MTFEIDTGASIAPTAVSYVPDWALDQCVGQPDARVIAYFAQHLIGEMNPDRGDGRAPKKMETVRKHFLKNWHFVRLMADEDPDLFDAILVAYGERALDPR